MNSADKRTEAADHSVHAFLDVSAERCPMTFVRVRLALDRMGDGEVLEVAFAGREPRENLPRSARELGHEVLALEETGPDRGRLRIRVRRP